MRRLFVPILAAALAFPVMASAESWQAGASDSHYYPSQYRLSAADRELLDRLSPELRQSVLSRMGPRQSVSELVESTILNQLAMENQGVRSLHRFGSGYSAEVLTADGNWEPVNIDPMNWQSAG